MGSSQSLPSVKQHQYSVEVPDTKKPGSSSIYVGSYSRAYLYSKNSSGDTLYESFNYACNKFAEKEFLGTRKKLAEGFGPYEWMSFQEVKEKSQRIGWGLSELGLTLKDENNNSFLGIYSNNRAEWVLTEFACISQDITSVPIYDTLQPDALEFIVDETLMKGVACNSKGTISILKIKEEGKANSLNIIIQFEDVDPQTREKCLSLGVKIYSIKELEKTEKGCDVPPKPNSIFTICYTSGTTGRAKGAMISHKNMVAGLGGLQDFNIVFEPNDVHISYLPLAHIMERITLHHLTRYGLNIGFYQGDMLKLREDLIELKPTFLLSAPRLFNRFYDMVIQYVNSQPPPKRNLIQKAIKEKLNNLKNSNIIEHKIWDLLIFNKIKSLLGGRIRRMTSGSAPISGEVMDLLKVAFSCQFIEGYGQTETAGVGFLTYSSENKTGIVGGPATTCEYKFEDVPEMEYFSTDLDKEGNPSPRGEICFRGGLVFCGYYKNLELTREAIDDEGWLHTGDIGVRNFQDGSLSIIDRKKNFFKLQQGEFVSPSKIENIYMLSPFIMQIFVHGDSLKNFLVAVVVPDEIVVRKTWAKLNGFPDGCSFEEICRSDKLKIDILNDMKRLADQEKLLGFEGVKNIYVESKVWTSADVLTPTQKLMRFKARQKYEEVLRDLY